MAWDWLVTLARIVGGVERAAEAVAQLARRKPRRKPSSRAQPLTHRDVAHQQAQIRRATSRGVVPLTRSRATPPPDPPDSDGAGE